MSSLYTKDNLYLWKDFCIYDNTKLFTSYDQIWNLIKSGQFNKKIGLIEIYKEHKDIHKFPSVIEASCVNGDLDLIKYCIENELITINHTDNIIYSAPIIYYAVRGASAELVEYLLDNGANLHYKTVGEYNLLDVCLEGKIRLPIINVLLRKGLTFTERALNIIDFYSSHYNEEEAVEFISVLVKNNINSELKTIKYYIGKYKFFILQMKDIMKNILHDAINYKWIQNMILDYIY
jgi:hypothetical protein